MRLCLSALAAAIALGGCSSSPGDSKIGKLEFWEWFEWNRGQYADAVDQGREGAGKRASLEQAMKFQIDKRYDSIVERAATETDWSKRELAISALGFSQRPEAALHLQTHLADPVPKVRGTAAAAIGILNPSKPPMDKIEPLLAEPDSYVRQAALFAFKLLGSPDRKPSPEAMRRIEKLAIEDSEFQLRNEAVLALGRIKDEKSVDVLRKCLTDESVFVRGNAAQVLAGFDSKSARSAVPALIERLRDGETGVVERAHYALKAITGVDMDPQYASWVDWLNEISKVLQFVCEKDKQFSSAPGACPTCGLQMEAQAIPEAEFACPQHTEVVSRKPGKCFKCQKELLPRKKDDQK
ncbi:MAG TPA: HEAT repeat domain-containing protein [Planctomycetota bacterium]|nr:HEAT repeat domain-containing protein [Planctomycetota bacterium]